MDGSSLHLESGNGVDPELRETESDLLFSAAPARGARHTGCVLGWRATLVEMTREAGD